MYLMSHGPYKEYVVDGAEMSCSACGTHNDANPASLPASINGGLYIHRVDTKRVTIQSKRVCTEEDKKLICKAPLYCMRTGMACTPMLGEWINLRGRAANVKTKGYHFLLDDATIQCEKGGGILTFVNSGQTLDKPLPIMNFKLIPSKAREIFFALSNPIAANKIGQYKKNGNNISTIAVLFASNIHLPQPEVKEGIKVNAFRHSFWQAMITSEYGQDISSDAGNAHEENPKLLQKIAVLSQRGLVVSSLLDIEVADEIADLHNNIIGQTLGSENPTLSNSDLAEKLLVIFKENGLYIAEKYNDTKYYKVRKDNIDQETYDKAIEAIHRGLDPKNKDRQNERG